MLHGGDDPVVERAQSDALVAALRVAPTEVEYKVYVGEGHGFEQPDTLIDELNRTDAFLTRHLRSS